MRAGGRACARACVSACARAWGARGGGGGGKNIRKGVCRVGYFQFQGIFPRLIFNLSSLLFCFLIKVNSRIRGKC